MGSNNGYNNDELRILVQAELDSMQVIESANKAIDNINKQKSSIKKINVNVGFDRRLLKTQLNEILKEINSELKTITLDNLGIKPKKSDTDVVKKDIREVANELTKLERIQNKVNSQRFKNFVNAKSQFFDEKTQQGSTRLSHKLSEGVYSISGQEARELKALAQLHRENAKETEQIFKANLREIENFAKQSKRNLDRVGIASDELQQKFKSLNEKLSVLKTKKFGDKDYKSLVDESKILGQSVFAESEKNYESHIKSNLEKERNRVKKLIDDYKSLRKAKLSAGHIEQLDNVSKNINDVQNLKGLRSVQKEFKTVQKEIDATIMKSHGLGNTFKTMTGKMVAAFGLYRALTLTTNGLKDMYGEVKKIDIAMTDLKKVTNETDGAYRNFLVNASKKAKELRTSISTVIQSTAEWARLGYSLKDAQKNAEASIILSHVGDVDIDTATKATISGLKAYGHEIKDVMQLVDKYNEVGNNYAISSAGIAEAMRRSASSLELAGNSLDEAIAIVTAGNSVIQNPEMVGTMVKTMTMRLRGTSAIPEKLKMELEEMGEDLSDFEEHVTQVQAKMMKFTHGRVNIMQDENTFKSTYQILKDIRAVWDDLSDKDRASVVELIGGKRGGSIATAIIENMEEAERVKETSINSFGSALKEQDKWADSIEGRTGRLVASWQKLSATTLDDGLLKSAIDFLSIIVELTTKLGGLIPILLTIGAITAGIKVEAVSVGIWNLIGGLSKLGSVGLTASNALTGLGLSTNILSGLIAGGLVASAFAAVAIMDKLTVSLSEQEQILNEATDSYNEYLSNIDSYSEQINRIKDKINELNQLKLNGEITAQQEKELDLLRLQNEELSNKLKIEQHLAEIEKKKVEKETIAYLNKEERVMTDDLDERGNSFLSVNQADKFDILFDRLQKSKQELLKYESELANSVDETERTRLTAIVKQRQKEFDYLDQEVSKQAQTLNEKLGNLSNSQPFKKQIEGTLQAFNEYLGNQNIDTSLEQVETQVAKVETVVKSLNEQMNTLSDRHKDLSSYIDEYNENGKLSYETTMSMIEKYPDMVKYLTQTKDGYVLNTRAIEGLNDVTQRQKMLLDEYIQSQKESVGISTGYLNESNSFLDGVLKQHNSPTPNTYGDIATEQLDTEVLTSLINQVKELNQSFSNGKITHEQYFDGLQQSINSIDFSNVTKNKDLQALSTNLFGNVVNGLKDIENGFNSGSLTVDQYVDSMIKANQNLLKLHTGMNGLRQDSDGVWKNTSNEIDEVANNLQNATKELNQFQGYLDVVNKNAEYIRENLDMGEIHFDVSDEASSNFQSLFESIRSEIEQLRVDAPNMYQNIAQAIADAHSTTLESVLDTSGRIKDEFMNDSKELNAIMSANNANMAQSVSKTKVLIGNIVNSLGNIIKNFNFSIDIEMQGIGKQKIFDSLFKGSNISSKLTFKGAGFVPTKQMNEDYRSGIIDESGLSPMTPFVDSVSGLVDHIIGNDTSFKMEDFLTKGSSIPATRSPKKGKGGGGSKDKKEIDTVNEYEQAIKRLDLAISKLQNSREKMIEGSDEYNRSLKQELELTRQKQILTQKELSITTKNLEKYKGLKEPNKNAGNKTIEDYNKKLKKKTELENKAIDLQKTLIDLDSKQEDILRKQADIIAESSNKRMSELEKEISIIESRQKLMQKDSKDYFDFQTDKINLLIEKQRQYKLDVINTKALLESANVYGYSGSQKEKWLSDLKEAEKGYYDGEFEIKEAEKEQRLDSIRKRIESLSLITETFNNILGDFKDKLGMLSDDDYVNRIDTITGAMSYAQSNIMSLYNAYADLRNIQPQTKEEAEELGREMTNLAKQIFDTKKAAIEYKKQLDLLMVDQLSSKFKSDIDKLNGLIALFNHNISMLDNGLVDGTDITLDIGILPDIPQSNYDKERAELDALFAEKQKYEQEIQEIKRQSFEEQSKMRDRFNEETLTSDKEFNEETQKEMVNNYDEIVRLLANGLGIEVDTLDNGHKTMLDIVKSSLFETKAIYNMTWQEIVATVSQALNAISQANKKAGEFAYANFDANNNFLGLTYGKSGKSNHFSNSAYVVTESGKVFNTKGSKKSNVPDYLKRIPKYADGTEGHKGGVALISEFDREEMVIFPDGTTKVFRNATLVDLPKGSHVLSPQETKDIKNYVGNKFDEGRIPKYAEGTIPKYARGLGSFVERLVKPIVDKVKKEVVREVEKQTIDSFSYDGLYHGNRTFGYKDGTKQRDAHGVETTYRNAVSYVDKQGRTIITTKELADAMIKNIAASGGSVADYQFKELNRTIRTFDLDNTRAISHIQAAERQRRDGRGDLSQEGQRLYNQFLNHQKTQLNKMREEENRKNKKDYDVKTDPTSPTFGYSYGSQDYYNRYNQTAHTKELDKIKFDSFLPKEVVQEFEEYKKQREIVQTSIKAEQELIKKHFADGKLRKDIEEQIQSLVEKIDQQTRKDIEMQFKMTESVLKKQQELAKEYMNKTEKAYLDGIKNGLSTDALKKLRDEYAEARQEHQQYEQALKNNIKSRFDYEFALMDKRQEKYKEFQNDLSFKIDILNTATKGKDFKQQFAYNEQMVSSFREQLQSLVNEYKELEKAQSQYSVGSFEWNLYEAQLKKIKSQVQGVNKSIVDLIAKNKEISKSRLDDTFKNLNKDVEKLLYNGKTRLETEREINKEKDKYSQYVSGIEKEYALDMLIRDLRKEKIADFDVEIQMMQRADKLNRDELETLRKKVEIKKLEVALQKVKDEHNIQNLQKDENGNWDFKWVEDEKLIKDLEDKLTQAKIDMIKWNKDLEFKTSDLTMKEKLDFMERLQEIQKKALEEEYKNSDEFVSDLNKLGLTMKDYQNWANELQDKLTDKNGNQESIFGLMKSSFVNYTDVIKDMNTRLEALLLALEVNKTIFLHNAYNNENVYKPIGKPTDRVISDVTGSPSAITKLSETNDLSSENIRKFLESIKTTTLDLQLSNIVNSIKNNGANGIISENVTNSYHFDKLELHGVNDITTFITELSKLNIYTKP